MLESPLRNKKTWILLARLRPYTDPYRRDVVSIIMATVVALPPAWAIPLLVTQLFSTPGSRTTSHPTLAMIGLGSCVVAGAFASWWKGAAVSRLRVKSLHRLRIAALRALRRTDLDQVSNNASSTDVRLAEDIAQIANALPDTWIGVAGALLQAIVALGLLIVIAPAMLVASLIGVVAIGILTWLTSKPLRAAGAIFNEAQDRSRSRVTDSLRHESLLRSANAESTDLMQLVQELARTGRATLKRDLLGLALGHPIVILSGLFPLALLALWALDPSSGSLGAGTLIAAFILMGQMFEGVSRASSAHTSLQSTLAAIDRVMAVIDLRDSHPAAQGGITVDSLQGPIVFEHVSAGYDGVPVLHDISLSVQAGEHIAIVGRSGSGKSTLLGLLWRAREPLSGKISINGILLKDLNPTCLRRRVAVLPQDTPLLDRTVRQNLILANPFASGHEIENVLRCVALTDVIQRLENGLETPVGSRGSRLSGGERARLALARELLKSPDIVLLDEATSQMDPITEQHVLAGIKSLTVGRTTFVIAHRMETARRANRILVLDEGRAVGFGTHDELLTTCPVYQALRLAEAMKEGASA